MSDLKASENWREIEALRAQARNSTSSEPPTDAERWQAIAPYLSVVRHEPGEWTCWLELACIPFRSQSTDPTDIADKLVGILRERRAVLVIPPDNARTK